MRRVELQRLHLRNFKGAADFELRLDGADAHIYGANAAGKTTLQDAYTWLLFEKDAAGRKDFDIKTLRDDGSAASGLEHEVEGVFLIDGEELNLRRVYAEKWVKKRGAATAEFTGHETSHFVDGVPVTKGEYAKRVAGILDETTWRLLSDPGAFQALHWQERRRVLLDVCGDVTDEEVIAGDAELKGLPSILGKRTLDEHRKVVASRRAELNSELRDLPVRISEVQRGVAGIEVDATSEQLESVLKGTRAERSQVSESIAEAKAGGSDAAAERKRLREVEDELSKLERDALAAADDAALVQRRELLHAQEAVTEVESGLVRARAELRDATERLERHAASADQLRADWVEVNARKIEAHTDDTCSACGQGLPADQVEAAHAKAVAQLNAKKASELERIAAAGKSAARDADEARTAITAAEGRIEQLEKKLERAQADAEKVQKAPAKKVADVTTTKAYTTLAAERDSLTRQIEKLTSGDDSALEELQAEGERLDKLISGFQEDLAKLQQVATASKRVEDLKEQEKSLTAEYERLEHELYLADQFMRTKVAMLEDRVASKFSMARFRLFKQQVNGGLDETCDTTYNGVPYESLNGAARINVGLDVLNTLAQHHDFATPVWIDQAESVTDIIPTVGQQVALVVSGKDAKLRVETHNLEEVAA